METLFKSQKPTLQRILEGQVPIGRLIEDGKRLLQEATGREAVSTQYSLFAGIEKARAEDEKDREQERKQEQKPALLPKSTMPLLKARLKDTAERVLSGAWPTKLLAGIPTRRAFSNPEEEVQIARERNVQMKELMARGVGKEEASRRSPSFLTPTAAGKQINLALGFVGGMKEVKQKKFYHVTSNENVPSIMKKGLTVGNVPSEASNIGTRSAEIYLSDLKQAKVMKQQVESMGGKVSILEIKLPKSFKLTEDLTMPAGTSFSTKKGIPPEYVKEIRSIKIKPLAVEARKYKSAEEFVKSEKAFGKEVGVTRKELEIKGLRVNAVQMEDAGRRIVKEGQKVASKEPIDVLFDIPSGEYRVLDGHHRLVRAIDNKAKTIPARIYYGESSATGRFSLDPKSLQKMQTKSQLTDIWNKANKGGGAKGDIGAKPLIGTGAGIAGATLLPILSAKLDERSQRAYYDGLKQQIEQAGSYDMLGGTIQKINQLIKDGKRRVELIDLAADKYKELDKQRMLR